MGVIVALLSPHQPIKHRSTSTLANLALDQVARSHTNVEYIKHSIIHLRYLFFASSFVKLLGLDSGMRLNILNKPFAGEIGYG